MIRSGWFAVAIMAILLCWVTPAAAQGRQSSPSENREELSAVLLQARDAVIELATNDDSSLNTSISTRVRELADAFLSIGDRKNVRYLQRHLPATYADEIAHILEPEINLLDGAALTRAVHIHDPFERMQMLGRITVAQYKNGNSSAGDHALELAIRAGLEQQKWNEIVCLPNDKLLLLASSLDEEGYKDSANKVILRAESRLHSTSATGWEWRSLAETSIHLGKMALAREALNHVSEETGRSEIEDRLRAAAALAMEPEAGLRQAGSLVDAQIRVNTLCEMASRWSAAGDLLHANSAIRLALASVAQEEDNTFEVSQLNDIAWTQIEAGDIGGAEQTLNLALTANEKERSGSDQVWGWVVVADTEALLGHFDRAHDIALKIDDHYFRGQAWNRVAKREVGAGQSVHALRWASTLTDPDERSSALLGIVEGMIEKQAAASKQ